MPDENKVEESDLKEREEAFNKELKQALGKYELIISAQAHISQDGRVFATPIIISARQLKKEEEKPTVIPA